MTSSSEHAHHEHPNYVKIWAILVGLLIVSVVGPMLGHPVLTLVTAFGVAGVKAYLVATHFLHLGREKRYIAYALFTSVAFMVLFFAGTSPDVMAHQGRQWTNVAAKQEVERALAEGEAHPSENH